MFPISRTRGQLAGRSDRRVLRATNWRAVSRTRQWQIVDGARARRVPHACRGVGGTAPTASRKTPSRAPLRPRQHAERESGSWPAAVRAFDCRECVLYEVDRMQSSPARSETMRTGRKPLQIPQIDENAPTSLLAGKRRGDAALDVVKTRFLKRALSSQRLHGAVTGTR